MFENGQFLRIWYQKISSLLTARKECVNLKSSKFYEFSEYLGQCIDVFKDLKSTVFGLLFWCKYLQTSKDEGLATDFCCKANTGDPLGNRGCDTS